MNITLFKGEWNGVQREIYLRPVFGHVICAAYPTPSSRSGFELIGWGVTLHTGKANHHFGFCRHRWLWADQK